MAISWLFHFMIYIARSRKLQRKAREGWNESWRVDNLGLAWDGKSAVANEIGAGIKLLKCVSSAYQVYLMILLLSFTLGFRNGRKRKKERLILSAIFLFLHYSWPYQPLQHSLYRPQILRRWISCWWRATSYFFQNCWFLVNNKHSAKKSPSSQHTYFEKPHCHNQYHFDSFKGTLSFPSAGGKDFSPTYWNWALLWGTTRFHIDLIWLKSTRLGRTQVPKQQGGPLRGWRFASPC